MKSLKSGERILTLPYSEAWPGSRGIRQPRMKTEDKLAVLFILGIIGAFLLLILVID